MFYQPLTSRDKNKENSQICGMKTARNQIRKSIKELKNTKENRRGILSNTLGELTNIQKTPIKKIDYPDQIYQNIIPKKNKVKFIEKVQSPMLQNNQKKSTISKKQFSVISTSTYKNSCVGQFQSTQNKNTNQVIQQQYLRAVEKIKQSGQKYVDEIFPCNLNSYTYSSKNNQLQWLRISEIYKDYKMTIWHNKSNQNVMGNIENTSPYLLRSFNWIKSQSFYMQKIFQNQQPNQAGIYLINIIQGNKWKKIIIDDYIPVIKNLNPKQSTLLPFIPKSLHCPIINNQVQIWPLLLQKAYAKYYSNYQCLKIGNFIDFIQQLTGVIPQITSPDNWQSIESSHNSIILAQKKQNNNNEHQDMIVRIQYNQSVWQYLKSIKSDEITKVQQSHLKLHFNKIYIYRLHQYVYNGFCQIRRKFEDKNKFPISIRKFQILQQTRCSLNISQKQKRFYRGGKYQYCWIRIILLRKLNNQKYQWVQAAYHNEKNTALVGLQLEIGQYFVLVMPQWTDKSYQLSLSYSGTSNTIFQRYQYEEQLLLQGCKQIAKKKGKLHQISPNVCLHTHIDNKIGLIIEIINNQKINGELKIIRSIKGLEGVFIPINQQLAQKKTIELFIKEQSYFSVVLRTFGGPHQEILELFNFGL